MLSHGLELKRNGDRACAVAAIANAGACFPKQDPERGGGGHMISTDDLEYPREYRTLGNGTRRFSNVGLVHTSEHRHTVIAAQSLEALTGLQKADMERKRDAFLDHLKNKYPPQHPPSPSPSHGSMRGAPERARDRDRDREREQQQPNYWSFKVSATRSPRHSQSTQSGLADQAAKLSFASAESLETMSEADVPLGFNRMNRFRQSLPLSRSASQTKLRSPGVLFLQFGDETRRVHITHELSSLDTLHALIVHMFPQKLTMGMLKSPNTAILIKDEARNVFYVLEDVRDIQDRSIIKIYRKEPIYASYPAAHLANGDLRREMVYSSRDSSPTRRLNSLPSSASPPSGSPSRSRLSYGGGRPPSFSGPGGHPGQQPHHPHHPHQPHPHHPQAGHPAGGGGGGGGLSPSPSAILERRDVKPDEEVSGKNMVVLKNEGLYADPYGLVHEGRLSIASTQSLAAIGDPFGFPVSGGLYRRGSVRSLSTYSAAALQGELEEALYKPGGPLYADSYASTLGMGFRLPPSSPQKIPDMQLRDRDAYSGPPSRASPVRQTFRKDSASSVFVESPKSRPGSGSDPLGGGGGVGEGPRGTGYGSPLPGNETETRERMEAMEKQIASLTGLVQSVLTRGPDSDSTEKTESTSDGSATGTLTPSAPLALMPPPPPCGETQTDSDTRLQMQLHLRDLQQNAFELRSQLSQLRKLQLQNQDSVQTLLKRTETEISVRVTDALRKQEDPLQRQRLLVEEERLKYLNEEELIIQQLHDLEKSVEEIQKDSSVNHKHATVQELEEKAVVLRKLGETLTELKNQFPSLQSKMRVVLRVEVEAVKFLKEEPHRLDALLKRCKSITDTLATLRRQVNEGSIWKRHEDFSGSAPRQSEDVGKGAADLDVPTSPPLSLGDVGDASGLSSWTPHAGSGSPSGPHRDRDSYPPVPAKSRALEELSARRGPADKSVSVEVRLAAERDWEEKRASLTQYSTQDINRLLEETQAELMKAIPDLDFAAKQIKPPVPAPPALQSLPPSLQNLAPTPEHRPSKPQSHLHKLPSKEPGSRRGSDELTVARYRTEKPSKSPPPPPPRRSFPSSPGLTCRSGEVIGPGKSMKKSESEEAESAKPHVKLRRTVSEAPRPASTPPAIASGAKDEEEEEQKNVAESLCRTSAPPSSLDLWPPGALGWKSPASVERSCLLQDPNTLDQHRKRTPRRAPQLQDVSMSSWSNRVMQDGVIAGSDITTGSYIIAGSDLTTGSGSSCVSDAHHNVQAQTRHWSVSRDSRPSQEVPEGREPWEELGLLVTEREVRVLSRAEAQNVIRERGEEVQTMTVPVQTPGEGGSVHSVPDLSRAPLVLLFTEPVCAGEAYRLLLAMLEKGREPGHPEPADPSGRQAASHGAVELQTTPGARPAHRQLGQLKEAVKLGIRTGQRTLEVPVTAGMEGVAAGLTRETLPKPAISEPGQAKADQPGSDQAQAGQAEVGRFRRSLGEDIRSSTYRRLGSLEETIRDLEHALQEFGVPPSVPVDPPGSTTTPSPNKTRPPVPPKPKSKAFAIQPTATKSGSSSSSPAVPAKPLHSSTAASRLKHLQQSSSEKGKTGKLRDDFLKNQGQQALSSGVRAVEPLLSSARTVSFSGRLPSSALPSSSSSSSSVGVFGAGLKRYPQEGALSSLSASTGPAKALLASLSASSLGAEALLLSSTLRHHRLLREQRASSSSSASSPLPNGRPSAITTSSSPTSTSSSSSSSASSTPPSPSPLASLTLSSLGLKSATRSLQYSGLQGLQEPRGRPLPKPVPPGSSE
ncbi:SRC kinase signaling inhibitor 1-like isoform X2 [Anguilla rostrata]|uniref:SRC kinase signaling inhibitor 1-like isoform X2 n=1 Tax=Anguilla rostrata TaxID=7938 RepID=UPI0030D469F0